MRFPTITIATLCLLSSAMAMPLDVESGIPASVAELPSEIDARELEARRTIDETLAIIEAGVAVFTAGTAIAQYVATQIKALSDENSCGTISGSVDSVNYQYHAASSGSKCDTTAQQKTIVDAIQRGMDFMTAHNVNQACFRLEHGGTWKGLLQLAAGKPIISNKCDSVTYTFTV